MANRPSGIYAFSYTGFLQVSTPTGKPSVAMAGVTTPGGAAVAGYYPVASTGWMLFDGNGSVTDDGTIPDGWIVNSIAGIAPADNATGIVVSAFEFDGTYRLYDAKSGYVRVTTRGGAVTVTYYFTMAHGGDELHFMQTSSTDRPAAISGVMSRL